MSNHDPYSDFPCPSRPTEDSIVFFNLDLIEFIKRAAYFNHVISTQRKKIQGGNDNLPSRLNLFSSGTSLMSPNERIRQSSQ